MTVGGASKSLKNCLKNARKMSQKCRKYDTKMTVGCASKSLIIVSKTPRKCHKNDTKMTQNDTIMCLKLPEYCLYNVRKMT